MGSSTCLARCESWFTFAGRQRVPLPDAPREAHPWRQKTPPESAPSGSRHCAPDATSIGTEETLVLPETTESIRPQIPQPVFPQERIRTPERDESSTAKQRRQET